jgi:hypothetical protein
MGFEYIAKLSVVKTQQAVEIRLGSGSEWVAVQSNEADNDPPDPVDAGLPPALASAVPAPEP